jgi:acetoin utilization deacetylase AcuC-like enzyme
VFNFSGEKMSNCIPVFYRPEQSCDAAVGYSPSAGKPAKVMADWLSRPEIATSIRVESFDPVDADILARAHDPAYVNGVLECRIANGFGNRDADVAKSLPYTVGSLVAACRHAVENRTLAVSPTSGFHHANYKYGGGFCTFNGLVIAAHELKRQGLIKNVLIIDGDAHHGDGTESCIAATKSGEWIRNITRSTHYDTAKEFFQCLDIKTLMTQYEEFWQDIGSTLVIYQAGADAWEKDPLRSGVFTLKQLEMRDQRIFSIAKEYGVPMVVNLAGGYSTDASGTIEPVLKIHRQTIQASITSYCVTTASER